MRLVRPALLFLKKKRQKNFFMLVRWLLDHRGDAPPAKKSKGFLVLFFKKERFSSNLLDLVCLS